MANRLTRNLPTINTKFVFAALAAAAVVFAARFLLMRAPDNAILTPIKKAVAVL